MKYLYISKIELDILFVEFKKAWKLRKFVLLLILCSLLFSYSGCASTSLSSSQLRRMDNAELIDRINKASAEEDHLKIHGISILSERKAIHALEKLLSHKDKWVRKWAIDALGNLKSSQSVPTIISFALDQNNDWVRGYACIALAKINDKRAYDILIELLNDENNEVRGSAAVALGIVGDKRAGQPLVELLSDSNFAVKRSAIDALALLDHKNIEKHIEKAFKDPVLRVMVKEQLQLSGSAYGHRPNKGHTTAEELAAASQKSEEAIANDKVKRLKRLKALKSIEASSSKPIADITPPAIDVISPKSDRGIPLIRKYDIVVEGIAHDDSGIAWVTVNDMNAALDEQGNFSREVYLKVGINDIEIRAMDTHGNVGSKVVTISRDVSKDIGKVQKAPKSIVQKLIQSKILKPTLWVLSIGVSNYKKRGLSLNFAHNDAIKLAEVLEKQQGKLYSEVQVRILINEETSRESILTAMGEFLGQAALDDVIFIFVAGHGIQHKATGSYYFLPYDADGENLMIKGLRWSDFEETLKVLSRNVNKIILAIDTCHSGAMKIALRGAEPGEDLAAVLMQASGLYTLAASKTGEESEEHDRFRLEEELEGHGAFTYALIKGLLGEANYDENAYVTLSELFNFVAKKVPRITKGQQHPYARISGTDMPIAAVK